METDTIVVTINVTDVDENRAPVFTEGANATRTVAENTPAGTNIGNAITATDPDNDTLTYLLSGTDATAFGMDTATGQLKTNVALDYETKAVYTVSVTASDGKLTATITVTVNVTDVDEQPTVIEVEEEVPTNNAPVFTDGSSTTRSVSEDAETGVDIGRPITATDADNDTLTYRLSGQDASTFGIDTGTGQLKTSAALDYETKAIYSVSVTVSDGKITDLIAVTINVTDVEEVTTRQQQVIEGPSNNAPVFTDGSSTTRSVSEDAEIGVDIGTPIAATDADGETITYTLGGTDANAFSMDSTTGQLHTNTALDYETKSSYTVTITASDGTAETTIAVTINVVEATENVIEATENRAPVFTAGSSTTRSVSEDTGSGIAIGSAISATDADGDSLTYTLGGTDASSFSIVSTSGQLQTNAALHYETKPSYSVTITVSDGSLTDSITVTINVIDVSDTNNAPVFSDGTSTTRFVAENTASSTNIGAAVTATDADNDTLTYTLGGTDASLFRIVSTSGQLQTKAVLDYETKTSHSVTITVSDGSLTDSITVTIHVTEVPENRAPVFTAGSSTTRSIAENTAANVNIGTTVSATDADGDTLTYSLGGIDAASFSIVSTSGQLQTKAALDYETKNFYTVTVSVFDGNGGSDSITVTIDVMDVSELAPVNERTQQVRDAIVGAVPNVNSAADVTAAHLAAITSLIIDYRRITTLKDGDFDGLTSLTNLVLKHNSISDISVLEDLTSLKWLYLHYNSISDISVLENLTSLKWLYLDYNSISDISALESLTSLTELYLYHNSISDISALEDLTALNRLDLSRNSISDISALEDLTALTYLKMDWNSISNISALEDLTALTELNLHWNPISDISPLEDLTALTHLILSNNSISDISALEDLTTLRSLALNNNSISDVSAVEGLTALTRLGLSGNPILDYGPLSRLKTANPSVRIDINLYNNLPVFSDGSSTSRSVAENTASSTNIGAAIAATDADSGHTLTYSLGGTDAASFSIVSTTGQLQTKAALDYETKSSYSVTVTAYDGNSGADRITVTINVTNVNEKPSFPPGRVILTVAENTTSNTNIGDPITATDPDSGDTLTYSLQRDDAGSFSIDANTGQVKTSAALDYETKNSYTDLAVRAVDSGGLITSTLLTINVTDVANAAPSLETPPIIPDNTNLLTNFPNPFNPETWIPYQLAKPAEVTLTIYNMRGVVVRTIALGHQAAGVYTSRSVLSIGMVETVSVRRLRLQVCISIRLRQVISLQRAKMLIRK